MDKLKSKNEGGLIVLAYDKTLDELFKQLNENKGQEKLKINADDLRGIGLRLQTACNNNEMGIDQIKICCVGDLLDIRNINQRLNELNITKKDLKEIYLVGHGKIKEGKGCANIFNGSYVYGNKIATALHNLFRSLNERVINSKIFLDYSYGTAEKDQDGIEIISIAKAIEGEFYEFMIKPSSIEGNKWSVKTILSSDCKNLIFLTNLPKNEQLYEEEVCSEIFSLEYKETCFLKESYDCYKAINEKFEEQAETKFKKVYKEYKGDQKIILTLMKNLTLVYLKNEYLMQFLKISIALECSLGKLLFKKGTFTEEEEQRFKELRSKLKEFINLNKINKLLKQDPNEIESLCTNLDHYFQKYNFRRGCILDSLEFYNSNTNSNKNVMTMDDLVNCIIAWDQQSPKLFGEMEFGEPISIKSLPSVKEFIEKVILKHQDGMEMCTKLKTILGNFGQNKQIIAERLQQLTTEISKGLNLAKLQELQ